MSASHPLHSPFPASPATIVVAWTAKCVAEREFVSAVSRTFLSRSRPPNRYDSHASTYPRKSYPPRTKPCAMTL